MAGDCYWNGWTVSFAPADTFGPIEVKAHGDRWYANRTKNGRDECLCLDGSWGSGDYFKSRREAEVAAVLAGMPSPDKKRADAAEAKVKSLEDDLALSNYSGEILRADYEKLVAKENEPRADYASMYTSACKRIDELRADYATAVASGKRFACDLAEERRRSVKVQVGGKEYLLRRGDELTHDFKVKA